MECKPWKLLEINLKEFIIGESSIEVEKLESLIQSMGAKESKPRKEELRDPPSSLSVCFLSDRPYQSHSSQPATSLIHDSLPAPSV